ncbi:facilitated trehalose transporter Tret1-2 homolog [Anoplophora glabripennis]|uniref:facilitated trehalose transporter Tret1-2 homolog n=1 Tax=Anoplophora glabripennis TaxID=217634 RepID=UPI0008755339|nr:facilitated trehalose transporter Tret1-2 homolog [Anoplophora glabripennis]XP_018561914.1 facilitated trehalose transporter Tret1-2 homolog [Anoplophora glabripennis]XP_018561922.1 facilitated trehalose transporter Tret1-2 homolog [Anoplophora glabripennis]
MKTTVVDKKNVEDLQNDGQIWPQVLAIVVVCFVPFTCGLLFSWSSPFLLKITNDKNTYDISEEEGSYFTVIPPISMILASIFCSNLNDKIGRKPTILLISVPHVIAWILTATATNVWMFYASRFFAGIADGLMFASVPMYIGEISTPKVRGVWGNALTFAIYLGQFIITVTGSYCDVKRTSYICICFPLIHFILFYFMPESPYFYIMKGRFQEARETLTRLRKKHDVEEDFLLLKADVQRQMSESGTWKDLFTIDSNRKALFAGIFLRASQQLGGISTFAVYTQYIFEKSGGNLDPQVSSMIFVGATCLLNLVGAYTLDLFGRRLSYIVSLVSCGVVLLIESIYFYIDQFETQIDIKFLNWIPITGMMAFVLFFSIGLGIVPTLMLGELFSASIKAKGLSVLIVVFGIFVSTITKLFHLLTTNFGLFSPFLLFSINCFLSTILAIYLIPETKGKTLEQIQQSLKGSKKTNEKIRVETNPNP